MTVSREATTSRSQSSHHIHLIETFPSPGSAWLVVAVLAVVTLFSMLDRQLPALLVRPLKAEFQVSDTQFSLLQGYAFAVVYTVCGVPLGRLVDRTNRRNIILCGVIVWSIMTIASAFASSFWHLIVARMGVGVGEAVLAPAAYSMIADLMPRERRGRALAAYYVSVTTGAGASFLVGGLMIGAIPAKGLFVSGIGALEPWRLIFLFAGLPGAALALLLLVIAEPSRHEVRGISDATPADFLRYLGQHRRVFARLLTYPAVLAVVGYGVYGWAPALFERRFHLPAAQTGIRIGLLLAVAGIIGTLGCGVLSDHWLMRGTPGARFRVTLVAWAIIVPAASLWPLMPTPATGMAMLGFAVVGITAGQAAAPPSIQDVVPNGMRGQAIAAYLLVAGLLGIGLGPTSVALVTDRLFHDESLLHYSLTVIALPCSLLGAWLSISGQKSYAHLAQELS